MNNREKFIQSLKVGKYKNELKNQEMTFEERFCELEDYSKKQESRDLENFKIFMDSSEYDDVKNVKAPLYYGDEEV